jgi:hypothetical protein
MASASIAADQNDHGGIILVEKLQDDQRLSKMSKKTIHNLLLAQPNMFSQSTVKFRPLSAFTS